MNLSDEITKGLALFASETPFDTATFNKLTTVTMEILLRRKDEEALKAFKVDELVLKHAYSALVGFILEGIRTDAVPLQMQGTLTENNVGAERAEKFGEYYGMAKPELKKIVSSTGFIFPRIVDVDWRMDYFVKSNSFEKANKLLYNIALQTEVGNGQTKTVEFACSLEELQDLVYRLKDATKQVENQFQKLEQNY